MTILLLLGAALALAYANGANDNFKATATLYGSGAASYPGARRLATAAQLSGSVASVVLAGTLLEAFGGKGLVPAQVVNDPTFLVAVGIGAAATVWLATRFGLPISTTHALVGGLAGAGLSLAPGDLSWSALGGSYFLPLLVSPMLATLATVALYPLMHRMRTSLGEQEQCRRVYLGGPFGHTTAGRLVDRIHASSAFALGFARGLNDTPKVLALLVAAGWSGMDPRLSLAVVAGAMAAGGWLRARAVAETLAHRITALSHGQGLLANVIASGLVIGASLLGSPVSTTHVSTGALFGIGLWSEETDWRVVTGILAAWLGTLPLAAALAAGIARMLPTG